MYKAKCHTPQTRVHINSPVCGLGLGNKCPSVGELGKDCGLGLNVNKHVVSEVTLKLFPLKLSVNI